MKAEVQTLEAKASGEVALSEAIFGVEPRADILQRMVTYQLAKRQAGTHKTKQRGEITGTTKKFGRQKGGGGARHGNRKSNIFIGGGKAHGPVVRSHAIDLPKKVRALALKMALSSKAKDGLVVVDSLSLKDAKTKVLKGHFDKAGWNGKVLVIDGESVDEGFKKAAGNLPGVNVMPAMGANVYDILNHDTLVLTREAVEKLEARFNG